MKRASLSIVLIGALIAALFAAANVQSTNSVAALLYRWSSTGWAKSVMCDKTAIYDASTNGSTQIVALSGTTTIYICGYAITVGTTATSVKLTAGTGTNCASAASGATSNGSSGANAAVTPAYQIAANGGIVVHGSFWTGRHAGSANALCVNASAANAVQVEVSYAQF